MERAFDKNGKVLSKMDSVVVSDPEFDNEFTATVIDKRYGTAFGDKDYITVQDGDGDCWDIEAEYLELDTED